MPVCVIGKLLIAIRGTMLAFFVFEFVFDGLRLNQYYPQPDLRLRRCNPVFVIGIAIHAQTRFRSVPHAMVLNFPNQPVFRKHAVGDYFSICTFSPNQPVFRKHAVGDFCSICTFSPNWLAFRKLAVIGKILRISS